MQRGRGHGGPSGGCRGQRWADRGERSRAAPFQPPRDGGPAASSTRTPPPSVVAGSVGVALGTLLRVVFVLIGGVPARRRRRRPSAAGWSSDAWSPGAPGAPSSTWSRAGALVVPGSVVRVGMIVVLVGPLVLVITGPVPLRPVVLRIGSAVPRPRGTGWAMLDVVLVRLRGRAGPCSQFRHASSSSAAALGRSCSTGIRSQPAAGSILRPILPPASIPAAICSARSRPGTGAGRAAGARGGDAGRSTERGSARRGQTPRRAGWG